MQKKAGAEAAVIIKNKKEKTKPVVADPNEDTNTTRNVLTTTQWLSVISIFVSMVGIFYKHEEIKTLLTKRPLKTPPSSPVNFATTSKKWHVHNNETKS